MVDLDNEFKDLMLDTIIVRRRLSVNQYNEPVWSGAMPYRARVEERPKVIRGQQGEETVSNATVYIIPSSGIGPDDEITLPDGKKPKIISVARFSDEKGPHHDVVYI